MNKLKALRLKMGKWILDKSSRSYNPQSIEHPKSFLFLRQDGKIGDYIVSSFVFREIKKFNPLIKIGVICTKQNAYLFQRNNNIDKIYIVKKRSILEYIKKALSIRKERYDVVIDPTIVLRNRDLLLLRIINAS
ncbi:TPA: glycosyltransferase family 9 protein, partial [Haemophilus influenzae]